MRQKKFWVFFTLILGGLLITSAISAAVSSKTINYLKTQSQSNGWIIMALKASGEKVSASQLDLSNLNQATTIERTILAVVAGGEDPTSFQGKNLIALLDAQRTNNQIGDSTLLNDDMWGILAYNSAGVDPSDNRISQSKDIILQNQNSDGGWGYSLDGESDSNDTAIAIVSLIRAGVALNDSRLVNAIQYLKTTQNVDGGFAISCGAESDSASTAWVISALQVAGESAESWTKNSNTPFTFLKTLEQNDGSYKWKASDVQSNAIMTSYVAIALAGTSYPVAVFSGESEPINPPAEQITSTIPSVDTSSESIRFRIEGSTGQICQGEVDAVNALDVVEKASLLCNFSYVIQQTDFGPYLSQIGYDQASGTQGWLYLVNWEQAMVGAQDYVLKANDYVTWYYGEYTWLPLKLTLNQTVPSPTELDRVVVKTEYFDQSVWKNATNITIQINNQIKTTDSEGKVSLDLQPGLYSFVAYGTGYVRSNTEGLALGDAMRKSIVLNTTVVLPPPPPPPDPVVISEPEISFSVNVVSSSNNGLSFGDLQPGQSSSQQVAVKNSGDVKLYFTASVTGDQLFKDHLMVNTALWNQFNAELQPQTNADVDVALTIPSDYSNEGTKNGELIFWARP